jgi:endoribonuclease Dicer
MGVDANSTARAKMPQNHDYQHSGIPAPANGDVQHSSASPHSTAAKVPEDGVPTPNVDSHSFTRPKSIDGHSYIDLAIRSPESMAKNDRSQVLTPGANPLSVEDHATEDTFSRQEDDADSSDDDTPLTSDETKPRKITARRAADIDHLHQWIRNEQLRLHDTDLAAALDESRVLSLDPADKRIISSPREYQVELFERAKEKNIIAVLATGSGKTLIAALLLRHIIEQELIDRSNKEEQLDPRISFFLVDKVSLVHQQWKVLKANLDHDVAKFHGELVGNMCTEDFWQNQFNENMVIVCTADILLQCLHSSYFRMDQINLLIFDEAHHAKKNHPYARIIKDFYADMEMASQRLPRILGMTASPVDAKTDLETASAQLEGLLHCEIATVDDPVLMRDATNQDDSRSEEIIEYGMPPEPFETVLWQKLNKLVGENEVFKKLFCFSRACTRDLGRWCSDRVWHLCITPEEILRAKARTERNLLMRHDLPVSVINAQVGAVQDIHLLILAHPLPKAQLTDHLSHKTLALLGIFKNHFRPTVDKCIVFVQQRLTAVLLTDLLKQPGLELCGIDPGALVSLSKLFYSNPS